MTSAQLQNAIQLFKAVTYSMNNKSRVGSSVSSPKTKIEFKEYVQRNLGCSGDLKSLMEGIERFEKVTRASFTAMLPGLMSLATCFDLDALRDKNTDWYSVELTRLEIAALLVNLFVNSNAVKSNNQDRKFKKFTAMKTFERWFVSNRDECAEKVACVLCYFHTIVSEMNRNSKYLAEKVYFSKRKQHPLGLVENPHKNLEQLSVSTHSKTPELIWPNAAKIVFVENGYKIGAELFSDDKCFQEEIEMIVRPELMVAALAFRGLGDGLAVSVTGAKKYSGHTGFGETFRCRALGACERGAPAVLLVKTRVVSRGVLQLYQEPAVDNYVKSAFAALHSLPERIDSVTFDFWGWSDTNVPKNYCAKRAVMADPAVIIMAVWLAASMNYKKVTFRQYLNKQLGDDVTDLSKKMGHMKIAEAHRELLNYCAIMRSKRHPNRRSILKSTFHLTPGVSKISLPANQGNWNWVKSKMEKSAVAHQSLKPIKQYNIKKLYKVQNYRLWERHLEAKEKITRVTKGSDNSERLFHGTDQAEEIALNGFDIKYSNALGMLGKGIYFADLSSKSTQYTFGGFRGVCPTHNASQCNACVRTMLICRVMLGKVYSTKSGLQNSTRAPDGCHSVIAEPCNFSGLTFKEYAIYSNYQAYPGFLVEFTIDT